MTKDNIVERLKTKEEELQQRKKYFLSLCGSEIDSKNFEHNAIVELLIMQQLKAEISELKHIERLCDF